MKKNLVLVVMLAVCAAVCPEAAGQWTVNRTVTEFSKHGIVVGAERTDEYLPLLAGKKTGVVTNHTGMVGARHLIDTLIAAGVSVEIVFAPEHGFRGEAAAGQHVDSEKDEATGIRIESLYGAGRKPRAADIKSCDVIVFDIQDVGCRFYTYLSTMHYVMEACAENGVPLVVLDRPNPNGMYTDGPTLDVRKHRSFVGMHPIPAVHGMTLGELARMINGEGWLAKGVRCELTVVPCEGYTREARYVLPVAPSPALTTMRAIYLYPSLCYFEATSVSVGRGGDFPFRMLTYPDGTVVDLRNAPTDEEIIRRGVDLSYLIEARRAVGDGKDGKKFLSSFFEKLTGDDRVRAMIEDGRTARDIKASWSADIERFKARRKPYLLYD